jgi:hypothetical protein
VLGPTTRGPCCTAKQPPDVPCKTPEKPTEASGTVTEKFCQKEAGRHEKAPAADEWHREINETKMEGYRTKGIAP